MKMERRFDVKKSREILNFIAEVISTNFFGDPFVGVFLFNYIGLSLSSNRDSYSTDLPCVPETNQNPLLF